MPKMSKPNEVIRILMDRDDLTEAEAEERLQEVREMLAEADPWEAEDIIADELGLEMDYIFDILG
jgi:hypothetical protein